MDHTISKYDYLGGSVGICNDGSRYVVAAPGINLKTYKLRGDNDVNLSDIPNGCVYVFYNDTVQKIEPPSKISRDGKKDRFGTCSRISGDGNTIAIGSYNAERVYVYKYQNNQFELVHELSIEERTKVFGYNLWISGDGNDIVVGAPEVPQQFHQEADGEWLIHGQVFHYRNGELAQTIMPNEESDDLTPGHFGRAIWLSDDAQTLMIGSMGNATVYEFLYTDGQFVQSRAIRGELESGFGNSVSRDGDDYLIGAFLDGGYALYNDTKITGSEGYHDSYGSGRQFGGSVKLRHGKIAIGSFRAHDSWFGYSVDIFPNGDVLVGAPIGDSFKGSYQILTHDEAIAAGLYLHPQP